MGAPFPKSTYPSGFNHGVSILNVPIEVAPLGRVWWVDANAAKNGEGTEALPFKTVATAITAASAGDTIMIAGGHTETIGTVATFPAPIAVRITSDGEESDITFTVVGTNANEQAISEVITGPSSTKFYSIISNET